MMPSPSRSSGTGGASAKPLGVRNLRISVVDVNSQIANWAPFPEVRPFESDGRVRTTSGEASSSNCAMTGPGRRRRGALLSASVPSMATRSQSKDPVAPSMRHTHMFPLFSSNVVRITTSVPASSAPHAGSLGCVPRSRTTDHDGSVGAVLASGRAMTVGSSPSDVSNVARTRSGTPSCPRSARRGWVTARWPPFPVAQYGRVVEMRRSPSLHSQSRSLS